MTNSLEEITQHYDLLIPLDSTNKKLLIKLFKNKGYFNKAEENYLIIFLHDDYGVRTIINDFDSLLGEYIEWPHLYVSYKRIIVTEEHIEKATALMSIDTPHNEIIKDMIIPLLKDSPVQSYSEWFHET